MIKTCIGVVLSMGILEPNHFNGLVQELPLSSWQHLLGEEVEIMNWIGERICIRKFQLISRFAPELEPIFVVLNVCGKGVVNPEDFDAFYTFLLQEHDRRQTV